MSRCLRYQNPLIYQHLASQYVAGSVTPRVRKRIERLALTVPELDRAIAQWSDDFSELHIHVQSTGMQTERVTEIWNQIDKSTFLVTSSEQEKGGFFNQLFIWQAAALTGALASLVLTIMLWSSPDFKTTTPEQIAQSSFTAGPDYLANMSLHGETDQEIQFIISAYFKNDKEPSRLFIQWPKNSQKNETEKVLSHKELHLWAENNVSGELVYLGMQPSDEKQWNLTKPEWVAITNSSRLLMSKDKIKPTESLVFSGRCIQLSNWDT